MLVKNQLRGYSLRAPLKIEHYQRLPLRRASLDEI